MAEWLLNKLGEIASQKKYNNGILIEEIEPYPCTGENLPIYIKTEYEDGLKKKIDYIFPEGYVNSDHTRWLISKVLFDYDKDKRLKKRESYMSLNSEDFLWQKELYFYESDEIDKKESKNISETIIEENSTMFKLFSNSSTKGQNEIVTKRINYSYDFKGQLYQEIEFESEKPKKRTTYNYLLNEEKIIEFEYYHENEDYSEDENWVIVKSIYFNNQFDTEGNITMKSEIEIENNRIVGESITHYDYNYNDRLHISYFPIKNKYFNFIQGYVPIKPF